MEGDWRGEMNRGCRIGEGVSVRIFCKGHNWLYGRSPLCVMHMLWDDSVSRI